MIRISMRKCRSVTSIIGATERACERSGVAQQGQVGVGVAAAAVSVISVIAV